MPRMASATMAEQEVGAAVVLRVGRSNQAHGCTQRLGGDQEQPRLSEREALTRDDGGQNRGKLNRGEQAQTLQAEGAGHLHELGVHVGEALETVVYTGKNAPMATRVTFEFSPMPIHSKSSRTHASEGTARRASMVGATNTRTGADRPISDPSTRPSTAPMPKPISTRWVEIATCLASSPRLRQLDTGAHHTVGGGA